MDLEKDQVAQVGLREELTLVRKSSIYIIATTKNEIGLYLISPFFSAWGL